MYLDLPGTGVRHQIPSLCCCEHIAAWQVQRLQPAGCFEEVIKPRLFIQVRSEVKATHYRAPTSKWQGIQGRIYVVCSQIHGGG